MDERQENSAHCRPMAPKDMNEVLEIERKSFEFPWVEKDFSTFLVRRHHWATVAEHNGKIIGFAIYSSEGKIIHLHNIAIRDEWKRQGVGSKLVKILVDMLSPRRKTTIHLGVSEGNLGAQLFFRGFGFRATRIVRKYYVEIDEDLYLMEREYGVPIPAPPSKIAFSVTSK